MFSPARILIITGIFPPDIGGPATYVPLIATALAERGYEITVITLSHSPLPVAQYPFPVVCLPRQTFKPWRQLLTVSTIIRVGWTAHTLFVNGLYIEATLANFLLRKPLVQKVVGDWAWERAVNQGWISHDFETFQTTRYRLRTTRYAPQLQCLKALRTWSTRNADRIIVPSHYLAHKIAGWGIPQDKITVIHNAVAQTHNPHVVTTPFTNSGFTSSVQLKAITVGRLVSWKRVNQIIEAIAQSDGIGLVIVGDGPERRHLEDQVRAQALSDRVHFAGQRSEAETRALIAACDLLILNSTYEGFPHVALEAMGMGVPVVATTVGGTPEIVRDRENGRLIEPTDHTMLREVLLQLRGSSAERQRLADGAKRTTAQLLPSTMIAQTEAVLRRSTPPSCNE